MNLFGTDLGGAQLAALLGLLATLVLWFIVLGRERGYARWFRQWEADRKARLDAERGASVLPPSDNERRGPWG